MRIRVVLRRRTKKNLFDLVVINLPKNRILDKLGTYSYQTNVVTVEKDKLLFWCRNGAFLSRRVYKILG